MWLSRNGRWGCIRFGRRREAWTTTSSKSLRGSSKSRSACGAVALGRWRLNQPRCAPMSQVRCLPAGRVPRWLLQAPATAAAAAAAAETENRQPVWHSGQGLWPSRCRRCTHHTVVLHRMHACLPAISTPMHHVCVGMHACDMVCALLLPAHTPCMCPCVLCHHSCHWLQSLWVYACPEAQVEAATKRSKPAARFQIHLLRFNSQESTHCAARAGPQSYG